MRRRGRLAALLASLSLVASAGVWPVPLPGQPVPTLVVDVEWVAATNTLTVNVAATDFTPSSVRLWPGGLGGPPMLLDDAAPFSFSFGAATLAPGTHPMLALATDGTTWVGATDPITVTGCNGLHELCARSYDTVRQATTHNAMSSAADGWIGPNQSLDVPGQLALGVRALMLDTYRAGDLNDLGSPQVPGVDPDTAYLCHVFCALGSQPLVEGLAEIRTFLEDHPGAVITVIIESYLSHDLTAGAFAAAGLDSHAFIHPVGTPWPTLGEMIDADTRLVVLQDEDVAPAHPWLMDVWDHAFETHFSNSVPEDFSCDHLRGSPTNQLFILNHFLTEVFGAPELADLVNHDPLLGDRIDECEAFHTATANFVTVDFVDIGDTIAAVDARNLSP